MRKSPTPHSRCELQESFPNHNLANCVKDNKADNMPPHKIPHADVCPQHYSHSRELPKPHPRNRTGHFTLTESVVALGGTPQVADGEKDVQNKESNLDIFHDSPPYFAIRFRNHAVLKLPLSVIMSSFGDLPECRA